ncbi:unnamed protein product [Effrenium voratum]|nr:unnamed protein product [Effrenium voratum]
MVRCLHPQPANSEAEHLACRGLCSLSRMADGAEPGPEDEVLDQQDGHLQHVEKRVRMSACMELVKQHAASNDAEVQSLIAQLAPELGEFDAKNYLFHSWLVRCYHNIRQREAQTFGAEELAFPRARQLLSSGPERFSARQLEVLNELLREDGAMSDEVEILGSKLSLWRSPALAGGLTLACAG